MGYDKRKQATNDVAEDVGLHSPSYVFALAFGYFIQYSEYYASIKKQ